MSRSCCLLIKECVHHDQQLTYSCIFFRRLGSGIFRAMLLKISILLAFDMWLPDSRADIVFGEKFCGGRNVCSQLEVDGSTCVGCRTIMGQWSMYFPLWGWVSSNVLFRKAKQVKLLHLYILTSPNHINSQADSVGCVWVMVSQAHTKSRICLVTLLPSHKCTLFIAALWHAVAGWCVTISYSHLLWLAMTWECPDGALLVCALPLTESTHGDLGHWVWGRLFHWSSLPQLFWGSSLQRHLPAAPWGTCRVPVCPSASHNPC